jgi:hypothetical protein
VLSIHTNPEDMHISAEVEGNEQNNETVKVVTVEEFLRRSAEKIPTQNYGRKRRKVADVMSDLEGAIPLDLISASYSDGGACTMQRCLHLPLHRLLHPQRRFRHLARRKPTLQNV